MKTSEFIKRFNELDTFYDINAGRENAVSDGVEIKEFESIGYRPVAKLFEGSTDWTFFGRFNFSPEMLELMAELAKTPPEEREEQPKYVILNGLPRHGTCHFFLIDAQKSKLIASRLDAVDDISLGAYTKEDLRKGKRALTPELAAAVDMMTVTLERAIELTEKSRHDDLD